MNYFYSPLKDSFFPGEFKPDYLKHGTWPDDAVEVSPENFKKYALGMIPAGKTRKYSGGTFSWVEREDTQSQEDKVRSENYWMSCEVSRVRDELEKVQDSDTQAVGTVSQWREYRKALRVWPDHKEFPNTEFRPVAPDV
jgi:hypothetical protein